MTNPEHIAFDKKFLPEVENETFTVLVVLGTVAEALVKEGRLPNCLPAKRFMSQKKYSDKITKMLNASKRDQTKIVAKFILGLGCEVATNTGCKDFDHCYQKSLELFMIKVCDTGLSSQEITDIIDWAHEDIMHDALKVMSQSSDIKKQPQSATIDEISIRLDDQYRIDFDCYKCKKFYKCPRDKTCDVIDLAKVVVGAHKLNIDNNILIMRSDEKVINLFKIRPALEELIQTYQKKK